MDRPTGWCFCFSLLYVRWTWELSQCWVRSKHICTHSFSVFPEHTVCFRKQRHRYRSWPCSSKVTCSQSRARGRGVHHRIYCSSSYVNPVQPFLLYEPGITLSLIPAWVENAELTSLIKVKLFMVQLDWLSPGSLWPTCSINFCWSSSLLNLFNNPLRKFFSSLCIIVGAQSTGVVEEWGLGVACYSGESFWLRWLHSPSLPKAKDHYTWEIFCSFINSFILKVSPTIVWEID